MLREETIYLKYSTKHGLLHDATFLEVLDLIHTWQGGLMATWQDLLIRGKPRALTPLLLMEELDRRVGQGLHQQIRVKLMGAPGGVVRSVELHAGAHPYAGAFVTQLDIRLDRQWFVRNPERAPEVTRRRFVQIADLLHPFQAHAHDTDDNAIQNTDNLGLLKRGFDLDIEGPIDLANNPGRELSRAQFRYVVNWLTLLGPDLLDRLGHDKALSAPATQVETLDIDPTTRQSLSQALRERLGAEPETQETPTWVLLRVGDSPLDAAIAEVRQTQAAVRAHLEMAKLAEKERWGLGYWQRKK